MSRRRRGRFCSASSGRGRDRAGQGRGSARRGHHPGIQRRAYAEGNAGVRAAQTHRNLEIIIVDDGSSDSTVAIASEFCAAEPRARLVRKENGGVASARNRGIEEARAEWVAPVDADDLWHPTKIEKQLAAAAAAPERPGFVYCWYQSIDQDGNVLGSGRRCVVEGPALRQLAYCNPVENGSALMICRRAGLAVGGYDSTLRERGSEGCEDVMLQLQIARRHPIAVVPEHLVGYRKHSGNMSGNLDRIIHSWGLVYEQLAAEWSEVPQEVLRWSEAFFKMALAEPRAVAGSYLAAARLVIGALRIDLLRWSLYLFYRGARTGARLVRGRQPSLDRPHFSSIDPGTFVKADVDDLLVAARPFQRVDERRMRWLAALDRDGGAAGGGIRNRDGD